MLVVIYLYLFLGVVRSETNCEEGWMGRDCQCYYFSQDIHTWDDARDRCLQMGSAMASVHSEDEMNFVYRNIGELIGGRFWLGLRLSNTSAKWEWDDASETDFVEWAEGEPSRKTTPLEHCVEAMPTEEGEIRLNDAPCALYPLKYVCKKASVSGSPSSSPEVYPHETTAAVYWEYWNVECAAPLLLINKERNETLEVPGPKETGEYTYYIHNLQMDTHYDYIVKPTNNSGGVWRQFTFKTLSDDIPLQGNGCEDDWQLFNCKCYHVGERTTWMTADQNCTGMNSHLVSIHSKEEQEFVSSLHTDQAWIGLHDRVREGQFEWTDGTEVDYTDWHSGEPNSEGVEDCVENSHWGSNSKWNDVNCYTSFEYVCAKPAGFNNVSNPSVRAGSTDATVLWADPLTCYPYIEVLDIKTGQQWIGNGKPDNAGIQIEMTDLKPQGLNTLTVGPITSNRYEERRLSQSLNFMTAECVDCIEESNDTEKCPVEFECPEGWINWGCSCYIYQHSVASFDEAKSACSINDSQLLMLESQEEKDFLDQYVAGQDFIFFILDADSPLVGEYIDIFGSISSMSEEESQPTTEESQPTTEESQPTTEESRENEESRPTTEQGENILEIGESQTSKDDGEESFELVEKDGNSTIFIDNESEGEEPIKIEMAEASFLRERRSIQDGYYLGYDPWEGFGSGDTIDDDDDSDEDFFGSGEGSGMGVDEEREYTRQFIDGKWCALKGSIFSKGNQWFRVPCSIRSSYVCKKYSTIKSVSLPSVYPSINSVQFVVKGGKCPCDSYYAYIKYKAGRPDQYLRYITGPPLKLNKNENLYELKHLQRGTLYSYELYGHSVNGQVLSQETATTGMFKTLWGPELMTEAPSTMATPPETTTSRPIPTMMTIPFLPPTSVPPGTLTCGPSASPAVGFSFSMSCNDAGTPTPNFSYTFVNDQGEQAEWQMTCNANDNTGSSMSCTTSTKPLKP